MTPSLRPERALAPAPESVLAVGCQISRPLGRLKWHPLGARPSRAENGGMEERTEELKVDRADVLAVLCMALFEEVRRLERAQYEIEAQLAQLIARLDDRP